MKLLFVTSTRLGDAIISTGILNQLIEDNPNLRITIACGPAAAPIFEKVPNLERVIVLDKMLLSLHWLRLWGLCIYSFWDLVIDLRNAPLTFLLFRKNRLGMGKSDKSRLFIENVSRVINLDQVASPKIWPGEVDIKLAEELIPSNVPVLAIGPTANWKAKTWRSEYFSELISRVTGSNGILENAHIAVFGRSDERPMALVLMEKIPAGRCIDLVGKISLLSVYACLSRCSLFVGNDSGLMHLAAASGVPTLGLFGPTQESLYAPWGNNAMTGRTTVPFQNIFPDNFDHRSSDSLMDSLTVDMVEETIIKLWEKSESRT